MSSLLFSQERHQPLTEKKWDIAVAHREIELIVKETESALRPSNWWPQHPKEDLPENIPSEKSVYSGATGVVWALEFLAAKGVVQLSRSFHALWSDIWEDYRTSPDTGNEVPSWFLGQSAILLMRMLHGPKEQRASAALRLSQVISDNMANPTWEIFWGSPGSMLAALFAYEHTKRPQWLDLYLRNADRLFEELGYDEELEAYLWNQDLYGRKGIIYGAGHGFAGNAFALLRGVEHFSEPRRSTILSRVSNATVRLASRSNGLANWPARRGDGEKANRQAIHVQWCHGAPGFILSLATRLPKGENPELDKVLLEGGELIWTAGPLVKGASFCHGTDGNGMAFLSLFKRTGDQMWLERARLFAMQAIAQSHENIARYGRRRFTLWSGDLGLAVFLEACLKGEPHMPMLDFV